MQYVLAQIGIAVALCTTSLTSAAEPGSLKVIFDNFSTEQGNHYQGCCGFGISGWHGSQWGRNFIAVPVMPVEDGSIRKIIVPMTWLTGPNAMTVMVMTDADGLPGEVIRKFDLVDLPFIGGCCEAQLLATKGIPVTSGTRVWIAARASGESNMSWQMNSTEMYGTFASKQTDAWVEGPATLLPALRVLGN